MRNTAASWVTPGGPHADEPTDIDARFAAFHERHPEVYAELAKLARIAQWQGHRRIGIRMLWEVMRWNLSIVQGRRVTLNDHFHSRYARLLMQEKDLRGIFSLRQLRGEE